MRAEFKKRNFCLLFLLYLCLNLFGIGGDTFMYFMFIDLFTGSGCGAPMVNCHEPVLPAPKSYVLGVFIWGIFFSVLKSVHCKKTVAQSSFLSKLLSFLLKSKQSQRKWQHFWKKWGFCNCLLKINGIYMHTLKSHEVLLFKCFQ